MEIPDHKVDDLIAAMNRLTAQLGRGKGDGSVGQTGGKAGKANTGSAALDKALDSNAKLIVAATKKHGENSKEVERLRKKLEKLRDSVDDTIDAQDELAKATRDLEWEMERQEAGVKRFGKEIALGTGTIHQSLGGLAETFRGANTVVGKMLFGFAAGASFALGAMSDFAKDAAGVGGFADLGAFKVGSVRQAKMMSGLGDSFIKVIAESNQGFKSFGNGSQEAIENLSDLARGFRNGSNFTRTLNNRLGKDFVKDVDRASVAVSELGMSQEAQATLMASIAQQTALSGKRGDDAVKASAKAFADTAESARKLSNTFGLSAEEVLKSINDFKRSLAGQTASTLGIEGAEDIKMALMKGTGMSDSDANQIALLMQDQQTRDKGMAFAIEKMGPEFADTINAIGRSADAGGAGGRNGKFDSGAYSAQMQREAAGLAAGGASSYNVGDLKYMEAKQRQLNFGTTIGQAATNEEAEKRAKKDLGGTTSEAGNIKTMNQLEAALNSLRWVITALTATMVGVLGVLTPLVFGGIGMALFGGTGGLAKIGSILGGALGKGAGAASAGGKIVGGVFSKGAGSGVGGALSTVGDKAGGMFSKLGGAASSGMSSFGDFLGKLGDNKTIKGAGTLALLGGALALAAHGFKTFGEVTWEGMLKGTIALGGLIGIAKLLDKGSNSILKGAGVIAILGASLALSAIGFKVFNEVNWGSLVKGTLAIGGLVAMAKLLDKGSASILKGALVIGVLGATMWVAGQGFKSFNEVNWGSLVKGAVAIGILGVAASLLGGMSANILIGALAIAALGAAMWVAGKGFQTFNEVDWASLTKGAIALGILGAAVFALGAIMMSGVGALMFGAGLVALAALGVTAAGMGLALGIASVGMKPFAESLKMLGEVSGSNLMMVGLGLGAIALGMTAFAAAAIVAAGGGIVSGLLGLVGSKGPLERIMQMAPMADKIEKLGNGIKNFGTGLIDINAGLKGFDKDALGNFKDQLLEFAKAGASDEVRLTAQYLTQIGQAMTQMKDAGQIQLPSSSDMSIPGVSGTVPTAESLSSGESIVANRLNATPLTPEILTQALGYLSAIVDDLDAIRGNTRGSEANTPVRLS